MFRATAPDPLLSSHSRPWLDCGRPLHHCSGGCLRTFRLCQSALVQLSEIWSHIGWAATRSSAECSIDSTSGRLRDRAWNTENTMRRRMTVNIGGFWTPRSKGSLKESSLKGPTVKTRMERPVGDVIVEAGRWSESHRYQLQCILRSSWRW